MAAISRANVEGPIAFDRDDCVVVIVGHRYALGSIARGVFERCELTTLQLPGPAEASRVLAKFSPDAVVLDTHNPELKRLSRAVVRLLRTLGASGDNESQVPLIVFQSAGISDNLRGAFARAGAIWIPASLQRYRQIAILVRRLCGLPQSCCVVGGSPKSPFNISAISTLHGRH